jgi:large repetitive protein
VTFTATVSPSSASGTIQFNDGATTLGTQSLSSGSASLAVSSLAAGVHSITAFYGGDANDAPNISPALSQTVNRVVSSVTAASSLPTAPFGQSVTLTATVTPATATGSVTFTFQLGSGPLVTLGTAPVSGGKATLAMPSEPAGTYPITASYSGDASNAPSKSAILNQTIVAAPTGVVVSSAPNSSTVGQSVVFTVSVTPNTATGTVQFQDGAAALGSPVTLASGQATLSIATLAVGAHAITAAYSGDGNNAKSTSPAMTQTVNQIASTVALASAPNPSTIGQSVALTATVTPASAYGQETRRIL